VLLRDEERSTPHGPRLAVLEPLVSPEHELVLSMLGTAERRKALEPRAVQLIQQVDFERLEAILKQQSLMPLVGTRLAALAPGVLPTAFWDRIQKSVKMVSHLATLHAGVALRAVSALDSVGIPAVPLKGALLADDIFDHAGLRHTSDIDLLVDRHDLGRALDELARQGWGLASPGLSDGLPVLHHVLEQRTPGIPRLELHWRIHWYETGFASGLLTRSRPCPRRGRQPTLADELVALLLFLCRDGFVGLRYPADIAAWWDRHGSELEPHALDHLILAHPELADAVQTSLRVAEKLVGLPRSRLTSLPPPGTIRSNLAERLVDWTIRDSIDQVTANVTLVDWLLTPPGGHGAFLRRTLFPSRASVRELYRLDVDAVWRARMWQALHGPKLLLRYIAAFWAIKGGAQVPLPQALLANADESGRR
jgi:putative nucleotidyltransferase-like protein